jgi:ubiquinone/menaquinone biosynthesis C-methylase UbiE
MSTDHQGVTRVNRTKAQAKASYDKMSRFYDYISGGTERKYIRLALERLNIQSGEKALEIGFGTGHGLQQMAQAVGEAGRVYGIDISSGMLAASKRRLEKAGLLDRVVLTCDDALKLPYADNQFEAVFSSFTLELFDSPEIPQLLAEIRRVLKPSGRLGVVSMAKTERDSLIQKLYEWLHLKFPQAIDCRPIYVEQSIREAGFEIAYQQRVSMMGLAGEIVIGSKPGG